MAAHEKAGPDRQVSPGLHVVFSSGGSRAILGGAGAILAFHVSGLNNWQTVGGVSGGSIPAALLADARHPREVLRLTTETDFNSLLKPYTSWLGRLFALLLKYRYERLLPRKGVFSWEPLRHFVDAKMPQWPDRFWTMAVSRRGKRLFTRDGVFPYQADLKGEMLPCARPSTGLAVCATCAVPGIIDAVPFEGEYLYDGALSDDGVCPVDMVKRHFAAAPGTIVAFDVGEEEIKKSPLLRFIWNVTCGGRCGNIEGRHPGQSDGVVLIEPRIVGFHALKFRLGRDLKWAAVIAGFTATVDKLVASGILTGPARERAQDFARQLKLIAASAGKHGELTSRMEAFLSGQGLF
jgi:predicted acylesterase/phospholipase RssA